MTGRAYEHETDISEQTDKGGTLEQPHKSALVTPSSSAVEAVGRETCLLPIADSTLTGHFQLPHGKHLGLTPACSAATGTKSGKRYHQLCPAASVPAAGANLLGPAQQHRP